MNSTFDLNRFRKLIKIDLLINKSAVAKLLLGLLLGMSIVYFFTTYIFSPSPSSTVIDSEGVSVVVGIGSDSYLSILEICVFLIPIVLFYNLYHKVKDVRNAMLPASQLEKVLSAVLQTSIITPALLLILFGLLLLIFHLLNPQSFELITPTFQGFFKDYFAMIQVQSLVFLGMFWFKGNKILKMILTVIAITVLLTVLGLLLSKNPQFMNWLLADDFGGINEFLEKYGKIILAIMFPLLPYTVAFFKFKRTQL